MPGTVERAREGDTVYVPAKVLHRLELFRCFAGQLKFPGYFGWNWDALDECLRDLSWRPDGCELEIRHVDIPFPPQSHLRRSYLQFLRDLADQTVSGKVRIRPVFPVDCRSEISSELGEPAPR